MSQVSAGELFRYVSLSICIERLSMGKNQQEGSRPWDILNSPFVILVLSSIVIGGITWAYNEYQDYKRQVQVKSSQIDRLESEIFFRMGALESTVEYMILMRDDRDDIALDQVKSDLRRYSDIISCPPSQCNTVPSMFPEFDEYNLTGLFHFLGELEVDATFYSREAIDELERGLKYAKETRRFLVNDPLRDTSINGRPSELSERISFSEWPVREAMTYFLEWSSLYHEQRKNN